MSSGKIGMTFTANRSRTFIRPPAQKQTAPPLPALAQPEPKPEPSLAKIVKPNPMLMARSNAMNLVIHRPAGGCSSCGH